MDRRRALNKHSRNSSFPNGPLGIDNDNTKQENIVNVPLAADDKSNNEISLMPVDTTRWVADQSETTCQICKVQMFSIVSVSK